MNATPATPEQVHALANQLRQYATHFAPRDWCYTRDLGDLAAIRYNREIDTLRSRVKFAVKALYKRRAEWDRELGKVPRWGMFRTHLRRDLNLPDGVLDGGAVITHWEETGEYLQYVQPTVGALIADLMDAHADLPKVQSVAAEMKRISDDYGRRIAAEGSA